MKSKFFQFVTNLLATALLMTTVSWLCSEIYFGRMAYLSDAEAFERGPIGVELMPVKYALVFEEVSGSAFRRNLTATTSLWESYGFLENPLATEGGSAACVSDALNVLPVGFNLSYRVPQRSFATPVAFTGLSCSSCHSAVLRGSETDQIGPIFGVGNQSLDLTAWTDQFQLALLDPDLSASSILTAYSERCEPSGLYARTLEPLIDRLVLSAWLSGARAAVIDGFAKNDLPLSVHPQIGSSNIEAGPGRTLAFRSTVRSALGLPNSNNRAFTKIPLVIDQSTALRPFSQYDGGLGDPVARSLIAAFASGASVESLANPEVVQNLTAAARYTETSEFGLSVPSFTILFPEYAPNAIAVERGSRVYMTECQACHGNRPSAVEPWDIGNSPQIHNVMPSGEPRLSVGTDVERTTFRYGEMLPLAVWTTFPGPPAELELQLDALQGALDQAQDSDDYGRSAVWLQRFEALTDRALKYPHGHPLYFSREEVRFTGGYVNNPIPRAFLRAPYLHNGSIPNMRQLINLDPRPEVFCRGEFIYDPSALGLETVLPNSQNACPPLTPFLFDTRDRGNRNIGHNFPWRYDDPNRDEAALIDLLEFLKTL